MKSHLLQVRCLKPIIFGGLSDESLLVKHVHAALVLAHHRTIESMVILLNRQVVRHSELVVIQT